MKILKSKGFFIKSFFLLLFLAIIVTILSWSFLEPFAYNFMTKYFTAVRSGSEEIAIIAIDDKSISYHRWPWPREYYGQIMEYLNTYSKPKVIGFDALIQSTDNENPDSDKEFYNSIKGINNLIVGFSPLSQNVFDGQRTENYNKQFAEKFKINAKIPYELYDTNRYQSISEFPAGYFNAVSKAGSVNVTQNANGYLTYMDQVISVDGTYYPSLGLRMYMYLNNTEDLTVLPDQIIVNKTGLSIPSIATGNGVQNLIKFYRFYTLFCL